MEYNQYPVSWKKTNDPEFPFEALVNGKCWKLRLNDFPQQLLYTLFIDDREEESFDLWPQAWIKPAEQSDLTRYYAVNDRPVKMVATLDNGMDVLALNMRTGEFERDMGYLTKVYDPFADVDILNKEEFEARVASICDELKGR